MGGQAVRTQHVPRTGRAREDGLGRGRRELDPGGERAE